MMLADRNADIMLQMTEPDRAAAGASDPHLRAYPCPRCAANVTGHESTCPHCGVDLALAAVLMERLALSAVPAAPGTPFVGDAGLSRFGEFLIKQGYITRTHLDAALARQGEISAQGRRETLGQVLLELRLLTREQLELASVEQVQELQTALRQANAQLEQRVAERTRELQLAYRRLTELDRLKGNFISNISHELRTPLTKITGFNALLAAGDLGPLNDDQAQAVQVMGRGAAELDRLIGDLIQFASGARGEMHLRLAPVAMAALVEAVVAGAADRAMRRNVHVSASLPPDPLSATADAERLRWVFSQLVENAIKFTPSGGHVTVSAGLVGDCVRCSVADTGQGIPEEKLPELFEAFHQLDGSATRREGGTGLGLAMVKLIVEAHESRVTVESKVGEGSRFSFDLPAVR
jgi:signal transduction histidine kinase